jgi:hypothetical protein
MEACAAEWNGVLMGQFDRRSAVSLGLFAKVLRRGYRRSRGHLPICSKSYAKPQTIGRMPFQIRSFVRGVRSARQLLSFFLPKPSFKVVPKGNRDVHEPLAYDFGQIGR